MPVLDNDMTRMCTEEMFPAKCSHALKIAAISERDL